MEFVVLQSYNNYIDAHLLMTRLESEGIDCWLMDENTITINPVLTNALGGIKLMVKKEDLSRAAEIFFQSEQSRKTGTECPRCKSSNTEFVSSMRKPVNWLSAVATFFLGDYAVAVDKSYHCFDCGHEFKLPEQTKPDA